MTDRSQDKNGKSDNPIHPQFGYAVSEHDLNDAMPQLNKTYDRSRPCPWICKQIHWKCPGWNESVGAGGGRWETGIRGPTLYCLNPAFVLTPAELLTCALALANHFRDARNDLLTKMDSITRICRD